MKSFVLPISIVLLLIPYKGNTQSYFENTSAGSTALSFSNIADPLHPDLVLNPASIASATNPSVGISAEQCYLLKELNTYGLRGIYPFETVALALQYQQFSFSSYKNQVFKVCFAKHFKRQWNLGLCINYNTIKYPSPYRRYNSLGVNIGLMIHLNESTSLGVTANQLMEYHFENQDSFQYTELKTGISSSLSSSVRGNIALSSDYFSYFSIQYGICYRPHPRFEVLIGNRVYPFSVSAGVVFEYSSIQLSFAAIWEENLGITPVSQIDYNFNNR